MVISLFSAAWNLGLALRNHSNYKVMAINLGVMALSIAVAIRAKRRYGQVSARENLPPTNPTTTIQPS